MKKVISVILCFVLLFCMIGCGGTSNSTDNNQISPTNNTNNSSSTTNNTDSTTPVEPDKEETSYILSDFVVVDNEYCKVTIKNCVAAKNGDVEIKTLLENKTEDKTLMFALDDVAVNGWMIDPLFATSVAAGKKANSPIEFYGDSLEDCGINTVDKIEFNLRVYDYDDWSADAFVDEVFSIYPTGLDDASVVSPERWKGKNEETIIDNDKCTFIVLGTYIDDFWGYSLVVYLENKSDTTLMFSWDDVSVNGFMIDPFWASSVTKGNKELSTISFSDSDFEENGIKDVEEIEFCLRIHDYEKWDAKDLVNDIFKYQPKQ